MHIEMSPDFSQIVDHALHCYQRAALNTKREFQIYKSRQTSLVTLTSWEDWEEKNKFRDVDFLEAVLTQPARWMCEVRRHM